MRYTNAMNTVAGGDHFHVLDNRSERRHLAALQIPSLTYLLSGMELWYAFSVD
jgi:hypothetical protein